MKYFFKTLRLRRKMSQFGSIPKDKYNEFNASKNWRRFPRFAIVVFISALSFLIQHKFDPSVQPGSFLYSLYTEVYTSILLVTAFFSLIVYLLNVRHIKVHIIYLAYFVFFLLSTLAISLLNLYNSKDLSLFAFVVLSIPLVLRTRVRFFIIIYICILIVFTLCLSLLHSDKTNAFMITQIFLYTFVGFLTTLTIEYSRRNTFHLEEELRHKNTILESISVKDPLTGVFNRRYMMDLLVHHIILSRKSSEPLTQGILDVDHFKKINDTLGHLTGDDVLKEIAMIIKSAVRDNDLVFRFGGEEFIVLFPETNLESANIVMQRIRSCIENNKFGGVPWTVTVSGGFSELSVKDSPDSLLKRSDELLYKAKLDGRNRIYSL